MIIYICFCIALTISYISIIAFVSRNWSRQEQWKIPSDYQASTKVSIVIAARNEATNLQFCIESILHNKYPRELLEIIIVDDHSEDNSIAIVNKYHKRGVRSLSLKDKTGKKAAIDLGVRSAKGSLIMTTDADCQVPKAWIDLVVSFFQDKQALVIAAPVKFSYKDDLLEKFQALDFLGMMAVTQAGIFSRKWYMANGANLAYTREVFLSVNGYADNYTFASGDDMFLIQQIAMSNPDDIHFLHSPDACVQTPAEPTIDLFIKQRIRWGTKNNGLKDRRMQLVLGTVFLFCISIISSALLSLVFGIKILLLLFAQIIVKTVVEFFYLKKLSLYFTEKPLMDSFLSSNILHIVYIAFLGTTSLVTKNYTWKGRKVK